MVDNILPNPKRVSINSPSIGHRTPCGHKTSITDKKVANLVGLAVEFKTEVFGSSPKRHPPAYG